MGQRRNQFQPATVCCSDANRPYDKFLVRQQHRTPPGSSRPYIIVRRTAPDQPTDPPSWSNSDTISGSAILDQILQQNSQPEVPPKARRLSYRPTSRRYREYQDLPNYERHHHRQQQLEFIPQVHECPPCQQHNTKTEHWYDHINLHNIHLPGKLSDYVQAMTILAKLFIH